MCENPDKILKVDKLREHWSEYVEEIRSTIRVTFMPPDQVEEMVKIFLGEHPKYDWRSIAALARECDVAKEDIERVIEKLYNEGIVVKSTRLSLHWGSTYNDDHWGLLTRIKEKYPPAMWHQKDQFDLLQKNSEDMYAADYYKNTNAIHPGWLEPCPEPCPAPAPPHGKTHTLESKVITAPYVSMPTIAKLTANDMFTGMNECLGEVNKLISHAQHLNEQVELCLK